MSISLIVMLGLPVLYLTGSLRKSVSAMRIGGKAFVSYFLVGAALSLLPVIPLLPGLHINIAGAFLCVAPVIYLAHRKDMDFRFLLAAMLTVLLSVSAYYLLASFTLPYLQPLTGAAVAFLALACLGSRATPRAPVLAAAYGISENIMALLTGQVRTMRLFDVPELAILCFFFCFALSAIAVFFRPAEARESNAPELPDLPGTEFPEPQTPEPEVPKPEIPEPDFPGTEFPEPEFPEPQFPKPEIEEPFPEIEFPKPERMQTPLPKPEHNEG